MERCTSLQLHKNRFCLVLFRHFMWSDYRRTCSSPHSTTPYSFAHSQHSFKSACHKSRIPSHSASSASPLSPLPTRVHLICCRYCACHVWIAIRPTTRSIHPTWTPPPLPLRRVRRLGPVPVPPSMSFLRSSRRRRRCSHTSGSLQTREVEVQRGRFATERSWWEWGGVIAGALSPSLGV